MPTYHLHLHLLNQNALPLSDFNIEVWIGGQQYSSALTDAEGRCTASISFTGQISHNNVLYAHLIIYKNGKWIYGDVNSPQYALQGQELDLELTINTRRVDFIPFRLSELRRPATAMEGLNATQQNYISGKLNTALQARVQRVLGDADSRLNETPVSLGLDYTAWLDGTLGDVLGQVVADNAGPRTFIEESGLAERLAQNPSPVREILHLDVPLIRNPIFWKEVQVLRTTELTDIILPGYTGLPDQMLDQAWDWERAGAEQWDALPLTEADKSILQRGFALARFTGGLPALVGGLMPEITELSQLASYDTGHLLEKIIASGSETPNGETPEEYAANLVSLAQRNFPSAFFLERKTARDIPLTNLDDAARIRLYAAYRYLGPADELGQPNVLNNRRKLLQQFVADNPGFDLLAADFFKKDENGEWALRYSGLPPERREHVRQQFMSFQRTMRLAGSYEAQDALLAAGIDSSAELMRRRPEELEAELGPVLDVPTINSMLQQGQQQLQQLVNTAVALQGLGVANGIGFAVDNYPAGLKNELEDIYGYSDLFGSQDYCECEHCKSIFGPAAYFVVLMSFVEDQVKLAPLSAPWTADTHPIALRKRRPDLWNLELTCENTNAAIPYLQIINEIKQHYIAEAMGAILGGKPANEVDIWAEFARLPTAGSTTDMVGLALNIGNTWKNSFRLAYNRPFEESRILLEHFGMRYADILQALRVAEPYRMEQAYLGLSAEEWRVLTTPDTNMGDLRTLRFGFPLDSEHELKEEPSYFKLAECPVPVFLRATGLSRAEAEFLLSDKSYLHGLNSALALKRVPVPGEVQEYKEWIEGLDNAAVLDHIHRLLRLQRHLPWSLRELSLAVQTLGGLSIDHIAEIARIREMQRVLGLTFEEAVALQHGIPDTLLYTRTVYNELLNSTVEVPVPGMLSRLFDPEKLPLDGSGLLLRDPGRLPLLLQALGATEEDFDSLYRMFFGTADVNLDWGGVSLFYRLIRLAKALGITGEEMIYLLQLSHPNPGNSVAGWILDLARAMEAVQKMPLSLQEIWFIIKGAKTSKIDFKYKGDPTRDEAAKKAVLDLIAAFVADERLNIDGLAEEERIFREHLALFFNTTEGHIAGMQAWYSNYPNVWAEAQANLGREKDDFQVDQLVNMLPVFERVHLLLSKLGLDAEGLLFLNTSPEFIQGNGDDLLAKQNTLFDLQRLATYARLKKQLSEDSDINAFRALLAAGKDTWADNYSPAIATLLGCASNQVKALIKTISQPIGALAPGLLTQIEDMIGVFGRLGIYEKNILDAFVHNDYNNALQYESALRAAFRAGYVTDETYEKAWEPIENRIQESRRDVLCAFLLALDQQNNFHDTGSLYAYFLVDVEMSGCARVSRILAATLSLQLYVHRVQMGLEVSADATGDVRAIMDERAKVQWEWRKNYRVWEANRKVFLYPENWIEPELRDDKSPLFKTLEDELLQQKISLESAEQAYIQYLKGFAEVGQLVIAGVYYEPEIETYHIFGRTATDPYQYFYRTMQVLPMDATTKARAKQWTAWEKVELAIDAPYVSPILHNGKLYLFWVGVVTREEHSFVGGSSQFVGYKHTFSLTYSNLSENRKWLQPQKVRNFSEPGDITVSDLEQFEKSPIRFRVYPYFDSSNNLIVVYNKHTGDSTFKKYLLEIFHNYALTSDAQSPFLDALDKFMVYANNQPAKLGVLAGSPEEYFHAGVVEFAAWTHEEDPINADYLLDNISAKKLGSDLRFIFNRFGDYVFRNNTHQYLFRLTEAGEKTKGLYPQWDQADYFNSERESILLTTTAIDGLTRQIAQKGLHGFLSLETQEASELRDTLDFVNQSKLCRPFYDTEHLDFSGAHGLYFRELFFHIPFLIADHLNAEGKYQEADYWYRKIFDPSAAYDPSATEGGRYWQFLEFRGQTLPKLLEILKDSAAIKAYEDDPFNPHAIARLRMGSYQKSIVMKYVDNLLDWGDSLFRRDTWESNTEAMMLYQLAHDILGPRPQNTGPCESAIDTDNCGCSDPKTTYVKLKNEANSPFLYYLENWVFKPGASGPIGTGTAHGNGGLIGYGDLSVSGQDAVNTTTPGLRAGQPVLQTIQLPSPSYAADFGPQLFRRQVFCVPNNEKMFDYWDRVADRLFKLRHCMNIEGVKRSLALFQPPIDPALLVAARAAGLSLDDVLNSLYGELPAYRFTYLLEKAKAFAGTVQGFGGALLSALEKKDAEQLTLLRSTHEQNILKLTREIKKKAVEEAKANLQGTLEGMANVVNRVEQYRSWIEENLNGWESKQQKALDLSNKMKTSEVVFSTLDSIIKLIPDIGAPTAMKYGGSQLSGSLTAMATTFRALGEISALISSSAGLEASFQRRAQDWEFQLKLAEQEIKQVQQQIVSGQIRLAIAEKDLEIHEKQIEQAEEVHDFYKNKFTGLGLYNYMATTLSRLHRMAFNAAMDLARQAEAAYRFETGKEAYYDVSSGPYWDASRAGLLSGEQLSLALQKMDAGYMQWNTRQMEIRQSFSMRMLDPEQLLKLRVDGNCTFQIPEWAFDIQYPGHYRRRIASVQITIPCVTGPYSNVAATLTMTKGSLRKDAQQDDYVNKVPAPGYTFQGSKMVATSSANNDGGQFELNFRDERYLPFEGAGAVDSKWKLELPGSFRSFDYNTISDVIFHVSYRSKYDGGPFKTAVGNGLAAKMDTLKRFISVKEEFPDAWFQLESGAATTTIRLTKKHFPFFAQSGTLNISDATTYEGVKAAVNRPDLLSDEWDITISSAHFNPAVDDVWLLVEYKVS